MLSEVNKWAQPGLCKCYSVGRVVLPADVHENNYLCRDLYLLVCWYFKVEGVVSVYSTLVELMSLLHNCNAKAKPTIKFIQYSKTVNLGHDFQVRKFSV